MKKQTLYWTAPMAIVGIALLWFTCSNCRTIQYANVSGARPVDHAVWDALLKKHVGPEGLVDYKGFISDSARLNTYLDQLEAHHPNESWSVAEQMAYWINAYNAYTVQLILRNYPVASIKDIKRGIAFVNSVWDLKFIHIQGETYDLNNIEHNILRPKFKDARIHAAINCASMSCPALRAEAYTAEKLERQLDEQMRQFVNNPKLNRVNPSKAEISEIFNWFAGDFKRDAGSVREYINRYAATPLKEGGDISYIDYNWQLNETGRN